MLAHLYLSLMQGLEDTDSGLAPDQAGGSGGGGGGGVCPAISYGQDWGQPPLTADAR